MLLKQRARAAMHQRMQRDMGCGLLRQACACSLPFCFESTAAHDAPVFAQDRSQRGAHFCGYTGEQPRLPSRGSLEASMGPPESVSGCESSASLKSTTVPGAPMHGLLGGNSVWLYEPSARRAPRSHVRIFTRLAQASPWRADRAVKVRQACPGVADCASTACGCTWSG